MKPKKMLRIGVLCLGLLVVLASCGDQPHFEKVFSFEDKVWSQDVKPTYEVNITDITKEYNFTLSLRTTTDYKYSNLWVFMRTDAPDGSSAREPFEILITDPNGAWVGNKTGSIVEVPLYFKKRKLPLAGTYKFTLEQGITSSEIDEVLDLGLKVDVAK